MLHLVTLDALRVLFVRVYGFLISLWVIIRGVTIKVFISADMNIFSFLNNLVAFCT